MVEIKLVKYADELDQLILLMKQVFKAKSTRESWTWRYINNPLAADMQELVAATDKGKIVAARPYMLNELWLGDTKVLAAQHCDTMVHADYRRQGLFNRMGEAGKIYLREHGCQLSFGFPGPMSRRGFLKQGYRKLADTEIYFRPVLTLDRVRNLLGKNSIELEGSRNKNKRLNIDAFEIQASDAYQPALAEIEARRNHHIIDLVRSESYLRWRFDEHPGVEYKYLIARNGGRATGFAAISKRRLVPGINVGLIVDYLVVDSDAACFAALVSRAFGELTRMGCNLFAMQAHDDRSIQYALTENLGFKPTSNRPYRWLRDFGYMDVMTLDDSLDSHIDIYDQANWRVTYGYPNYT